MAYSTFSEGKYFIRQREIEQAIAKYIKNLPDTRLSTLEPDSESILRTIEAHHGLLIERASGIYSFSHLTVQEYFTARYLVDERTKDSLSELVHQHLCDERWREIFILIVGMLSNADSILTAMRAEIGRFARNKAVAALLSDADRISVPENRFPRYASRPLVLFYFLISLLRRGRSRRDSTIGATDIDVALHGNHGYADGTRYSGSQESYRYPHPNLDALVEVARSVALAIVRDRKFDPFILGDLHLNRALSLGLNEVDLDIAFAKIIDQTHFQSVLTSRFQSVCGPNAESFQPDSEKAITSYLRASQLLVDCLAADCYVSKDVREELLNGLFNEP